MVTRQQDHDENQRPARRTRMAPTRKPPAAERPASTFEAVTRAHLAALRAEVAELKRRVNGLLWGVTAAVAIEIVKALIK